MADRCAQCESHAVEHSKNFGFGPPCTACEQHAVLHAQEEGCGGMFMVLTLTVAAVVGSALRISRRNR